MKSKMKNSLKKKKKDGETCDVGNIVPVVAVDPVLSVLPERLHKTLQDLDVLSDDEADDDDSSIMNKNRNNPWFTEEIASIVKLCRKYRRKHHKSKTKKSELKEIASVVKLCRKYRRKHHKSK